MSYTPKNWADYPDTSTPITAAELNRMEDGITAAVKSTTVHTIVALTQAAYDAMETHDSATLYCIIEDDDALDLSDPGTGTL